MINSLIIIALFNIIFISKTMANDSVKDNLKIEIEQLTTDLSCDNDNQCKTYGFGNRPCGGYSSYEIYSSKSTNEQSLIPKVKTYNSLDKLNNIEKGMASICSVVQDLKTSCIKNKCISLGDKLNYTTPIHYAALNNDVGLINQLISQGHDINKLSKNNMTALLYSAQIKSIQPNTLQALIENGANIDYKYNEKSNTALLLAVTNRNYSAIELLLSNNADPRLKNHWGSSLDYANSLDDPKISAIFKKHGYKIN